MKHLRSIRALVVLGTLIALAVFVVLPAFASTPGDTVPPASAAGVPPVDYNTGGQTNDCSLFYGADVAHLPAYQFRISNPKSQTYTFTAPTGAIATFTLTLNPATATGLNGYANNKYVKFTSTGAAVVDVGIKGGTDETRYNYDGLSGVTTNPNLGSVTTDDDLHASLQSATQLYSVSNLTFCFNLLGSVSGNVYRDANQDGTSNTGDSALAGWTVNLYKASTLTATTTSSSTGAYSFGLLFDAGTAYTVCEAPPSGTWAQTQPGPSSPNRCTGASELRKGYAFTPSTANDGVSGKDFGNIPATACTSPMGTDPGYQIKLAACKNATFVFGSGTTASGTPYFSVWSSDQTMPAVPMTEKMTFADPIVNGQPKYTKILYTDAYPFQTANLPAMPYCLLDPRNTSIGELDLAAPYDTYGSGGSDLVIPAGATSCVISLTTYVDSAGNGKMTAYVYSAIDGLRTTG